ncbi:rod-binding protein [Pseudobowmanella zhangzhouensis]|uniref:rod-binding protein n=1 Tax=Pseudobowmanella zhangzhouensis TaxID=1537679 RepID=UPI0036116D59
MLPDNLDMQMDVARNANDFSGLDKLRTAARQDEKGALKEVAKHFEAIFVRMMLKSMRDSADVLADEDSPFNSQQVKFYRDMHDQQLATELSNTGGLGLADLIVRQLGGDPNYTPASLVSPDRVYAVGGNQQ